MKSSANITSSLSHMTLATATKFNTHLTNSHSLQGDLKFHFPNLMNMFICLGHPRKPSVHIQDAAWLFVACCFVLVSCKLLAQTPVWRTMLWRLWITLYSMQSQLRYIPCGRNLHPQPEDAPSVFIIKLRTVELCHIKIRYERLIMW
jgi:hypothetical protein